MSSVAATLARSLYPYGCRRRVLRGPAAGKRFVVGPAMGASYALGVESAAPSFSSRIQPGMFVVDVGANRGQMTLIFATLVGPAGRVLALEPAPEPFAALSENIRLNGLGSFVSAARVAAADREGESDFRFSSTLATQGKLADVEPTYVVDGAGSFTVPCRPLDAMLAATPLPDVIKIDVEGAAGHVLRGARRTLETASPAIYLELHGPEEQLAVRDELLSRGYALSTPQGRPVPDPVAVWESPLWAKRP